MTDLLNLDLRLHLLLQSTLFLAHEPDKKVSYFLTNALGNSKIVLESCQASPPCIFGKGNMEMKLST